MDAEGRRDWESPDNIAWELLLSEVRAWKQHATPDQMLVVEGFCLTANSHLVSELDTILVLGVEEKDCLARRRVLPKPAPDDWRGDEDSYFHLRVWPAQLDREKELCALELSEAISVQRLDCSQCPDLVLQQALSWLNCNSRASNDGAT